MIKETDYVWEFAFREKQVRFKQATTFSPYFEITEIIEESKEITVFYNALCRYAKVFESILEASDEYKEWKEILIDIGTHILIEQERLNSYNLKELHMVRIMKQLADGMYGTDIMAQYQLLSRKQKYRLACFMVEQLEGGESITMYAKALVSLWETGVVYRNAEKKNCLLVYAGEKKSREKVNILKLVENIFLPIGYETRVFWETHFGVVGTSRTLQYGQIELL
ncbi:MAG: hypothetical protein IKK33_06320 [Lachnospiraceae bacterium]|nr:hypothetical protein [Lachnospiraceae bacterium]